VDAGVVRPFPARAACWSTLGGIIASGELREEQFGRYRGPLGICWVQVRKCQRRDSFQQGRLARSTAWNRPFVRGAKLSILARI
jgi:hypothetical protein